MYPMQQDKVLTRFLQNSFWKATKLLAESDVLSIIDLEGDPPFLFLLGFNNISHLIKDPEREEVVSLMSPVFANIFFPPDYLRSVDPALYLKMVAIPDQGFFHPNVKLPHGWVCLGHDFLPGTDLSDLIFHLYDIITYRNVTVDERDALNPEACRYLRQNPEVIAGLKNPPLRRRKLNVQVKVEKISNEEEQS
jgi:hypothetical protein